MGRGEVAGEDVRNPSAVGTGLENENEVVACGITDLVIRAKMMRMGRRECFYSTRCMQ